MLKQRNMINASPGSVWELEVLDVSQEADVMQMVDGANKLTLELPRQYVEEMSLL